MPLHREIVDHLERLEIPVPQDLSGSAIEILTTKVQWPQTRFETCFDLWRESLVDSGIDDAENWYDHHVLDFANYTPMRVAELQFGQAAMLDHYTGTDPAVSTCWSEDSALIYFLEQNSDDPTNPLVTYLDHETVEEAPGPNGTVSELFAILEPAS